MSTSKLTIQIKYYEEGNPWQYKIWLKDGKEHRLDGPAREFSNGSKHWWIEGKYVTEGYLNEYIKHM